MSQFLWLGRGSAEVLLFLFWIECFPNRRELGGRKHQEPRFSVTVSALHVCRSGRIQIYVSAALAISSRGDTTNQRAQDYARVQKLILCA